MSVEFFDTTTELRIIHQWARARYAAPWAVLGAVLLRVAASVGPHVQLPGLIGGRASLNLLAAFVSPSGGGKGVSDKVARLAWPTPILELPIGSGEGIAATFKTPDKPNADDEPVTAALINVPEVDTLAGIAGRQGSILLAQLKSMAMGEQIGQANASKATSRIVAAHSYRCCMSVGAQPGHTGVIFDDVTGGTPQRFLWFPTTDADMPTERAPDPAPLNTSLPQWVYRTGDTVEIQYGPDEIAELVVSAHIARQRGQADALDGHAMLTRCKVAAVLAIMHHRSVVSDLDWQLSAHVMATSDRTREWIVNEDKRAARAKVRDRAMARARSEEFVSDHKLSRAKSAVIRWLGRDGEQAANQLRSKLKADLRDHFGAAVAELAADDLIIEMQVERGTRYRLNPKVQGVPEVRGSSSQLTDGVPEVQGVPAATITDLDTRRSTTPEAPRLTAAQWFANHIAGLQAAGHTTTKSGDVMAAGELAGFTKNNLRQAASAHPDIRTVDRKGGTATWSIEPGATVPEYQATPQWLDEWLDQQTESIVRPDDARLAGEAAGHPWHSVRRAAGMSPRIESEPVHGQSRNDRVWKITQPNEGERPA